MAQQIRKVDYIRVLDVQEVNKVIEQINRILVEINNRINVSGVV